MKKLLIIAIALNVAIVAGVVQAKDTGENEYKLALQFATGTNDSPDKAWKHLCLAADRGSKDAKLLKLLIIEGVRDMGGMNMVKEPMRSRIESLCGVPAGRFVTATQMAFSFDDAERVGYVEKGYAECVKSGDVRAKELYDSFMERKRKWNDRNREDKPKVVITKKVPPKVNKPQSVKDLDKDVTVNKKVKFIDARNPVMGEGYCYFGQEESSGSYGSDKQYVKVVQSIANEHVVIAKIVWEHTQWRYDGSLDKNEPFSRIVYISNLQKEYVDGDLLSPGVYAYDGVKTYNTAQGGPSSVHGYREMKTDRASKILKEYARTMLKKPAQNKSAKNKLKGPVRINKH